MIPGIFGFSLIFELLVFYFAINLAFQNTSKLWVYLLLGLIVLISVSDLTAGRWADIFSGHYDFLWTKIFSDFGFR